jgi:phosphoglycerate dehydrogenase-like enzyme
LDEELLKSAEKLKLLTHLGSTVVPVMSQAAWERGIRAISAFDYFSESTAEGAIAYMLAALRNIPLYSTRLKKEGIWKSAEDRTNGLIYKTVGIVSYGGVARHVVKKLSNFNVTIKVYDIIDLPEDDKKKYGFTQCGLEELFSTCDVISVHTPYNEKTHHFVNEELLSLIKPGALFVNTARGSIVDQAALTRHLQNGDFFAALDVFEKEPIDKEDPLLSLDNVMLLPHQGGATTNLLQVLTKDLLLESHAFLDLGKELKNEISRTYASTMSKF